MKTTLILLPALFFLAACSDDDTNGFPRKADIEIVIDAYDRHRLTEVETIVYGTDLELKTNSSANDHLPYKRTYLNQEIPYLTMVNVTFKDNSLVQIGASFVPYTMQIQVEINGEVALSEQHTIAEQGQVVSTNLSLNEYFTH
ncbi:hypothetical protein KK083_07210 [Fulvivirgaceae bacterium PWU4]|uniref:DUF1735 domain-containing protein n=1 Tax=Chryseosolibacter histidini TaxID=2782349 RepID=A0AAP2GN94_9BACT|nr:hypothetical protein [Chryseosolibacter histidini]MBT1696655.1 hypothetical protein [Chryseosolibacter histidini]